jgi:hypothetical protein
LPIERQTKNPAGAGARLQGGMPLRQKSGKNI